MFMTSLVQKSVTLIIVYNKKRIQRISSDKASNLPKRDVCFILLKYAWRN